MYSMKDAILDHAHSNPTSTGDALKLLGLPNTRENIATGNCYLSALKVIKELEDKIKELEKAKPKPKRRIEIDE